MKTLRKSLFFQPDEGATAGSSSERAAEPGRDEITARAREIWEEEGRPQGRADQHWRQAQEDLKKRSVSMPDIGARQ